MQKIDVNYFERQKTYHTCGKNRNKQSLNKMVSDQKRNELDYLTTITVPIE